VLRNVFITLDCSLRQKTPHDAVTRTDWCAGKGEIVVADDEQDNTNQVVEVMCAVLSWSSSTNPGVILTESLDLKQAVAF
jgi:hypothetical protein